MNNWDEWELAEEKPTPQAPSFNPGEWELAEPEHKGGKESLGEAALMAAPRIASDLLHGAYNFAQNIPGYAHQARTEIPGFINPLNIITHPLSRAGQTFAGLLEAGQKANRLFKEIPEYMANRLNLIPPEWAEKIPLAPDITTDINNIFGEPQYPGEAIARGAGRNVLDLGSQAILKQILPHLTRRGASMRLKRMRNLAEDRGLNPLDINPDTINDLEQFLPNTAPYRNLLDAARTGNFNDLFRLQSDVGKHASALARSWTSAADRLHGRSGLESRNALLDAIHDAIQGQGHHDISGLLRSGQRDYRRYMGFKPYRNILGAAALAGGLGGLIPENALTDLAEKILLHRNQ